MSKLGAVKKVQQNEDGDGVILTQDQVYELIDLLNQATTEAESVTNEKKEGRVVLRLKGDKIVVKIIKVKKEEEENNTSDE